MYATYQQQIVLQDTPAWLIKQNSLLLLATQSKAGQICLFAIFSKISAYFQLQLYQYCTNLTSNAGVQRPNTKGERPVWDSKHLVHQKAWTSTKIWNVLHRIPVTSNMILCFCAMIISSENVRSYWTELHQNACCNWFKHSLKSSLTSTIPLLLHFWNDTHNNMQV